MWKQRRDHAEPPQPTDSPPPLRPVTDQAQPPTEVGSIPRAPVTAASAGLGRSVVVQGELTGEEDLTIEGRVDGTIEFRRQTVQIGPHATANAQIFAQNVVVYGTVVGDITATARIEIRPEASVEGDLVSPAVVIAEGGTFRGRIDMSRKSAASAA